MMKIKGLNRRWWGIKVGLDWHHAGKTILAARRQELLIPAQQALQATYPRKLVRIDEIPYSIFSQRRSV